VTARRGVPVVARLVRRGRVYAVGRRRGSGPMRLRFVRRARVGRYRLVVRSSGRTVRAGTIRLTAAASA
jgi:hypothetical protein